MNPNNPNLCVVCGGMVRDDYMLMDDVWAAAGFGKNDMVHMHCLIRTLGRPLVYADFNLTAVNDRWTCRMKFPCEYCLFEELKSRYSHGVGYQATLTKLAMVNPLVFGGSKKKIVTDKCTCRAL